MDDIRYIEIINKGGQVIFAPEASTIVINEARKGEKNEAKMHDCEKHNAANTLKEALKG